MDGAAHVALSCDEAEAMSGLRQMGDLVDIVCSIFLFVIVLCACIPMGDLFRRRRK